MSYTFTEKIQNGLQVTNRSNSGNVGAHLQGIEIGDLNQPRSALPVVGRNPRYAIIDTSINTSGSMSDRPWFEDVETNFDSGLGQDLRFAGTTDFLTASLFMNGEEITLPMMVSGTFTGIPGILPGGTYAKLPVYRTSGYQPAIKAIMKVDTGTGVFLGVDASGDAAFSDGDTLMVKFYNPSTGEWSNPTADVKFPDGNVKQAISFKLQNSDYGFGKEYYDNVPFYDLANYDSEAYVNESGPTGMFPIVGSFPSYDSALQLNGIIEPLEIRRKILGQSLFIPGERQPGAVGGFPIYDASFDFMYDVRENHQRSKFYEDVTTKGMIKYGSELNQANALLEAEYISDFEQPIYPFVERGQEDLMDYDPGIEAQLISMDPTVDEGPLPNNYVDQAVGWDSVSRDRMGSFAYRGLMRR